MAMALGAHAQTVLAGSTKQTPDMDANTKGSAEAFYLTETSTAAVTVTATDATPGASMFYTTNGTAPSSQSTLYTGPIVLSTTTTIEIAALASGYLQSPTAKATYTINIPPPPPAPTPVFSPGLSGPMPRATQVLIEDKANGPAVIEQLRCDPDFGLAVIEYDPKGSKTQRFVAACADAASIARTEGVA
jgi:hypothetical protein